MKKIELGLTGECISCVGLGTMYFGSTIDLDTSFAILDFYFERGGTFLDSANKYASWISGYRGGESETLIGKWMNERGNREHVFISSKVGFPYGSIPRSLKKDIIISECEKSLKRLGTDRIDLYFAHTYDDLTPVEESMEAFYWLKKQGKIRFAGASNHYTWHIAEANAVANRNEWEGFCCIQQRHSYLEPSLRANFGTQLLLTPEIQKYAADRNLTLIAYSPLLGGAYGRKDRSFPVQYQSAVNEYKLTRLKKVANELDISPNTVVLAWMLQGQPMVVPLVAGSTKEQMAGNLEALNIKLSDDQMESLQSDIVQPNKYS